MAEKEAKEAAKKAPAPKPVEYDPVIWKQLEDQQAAMKAGRLLALLKTYNDSLTAAAEAADEIVRLDGEDPRPKAPTKAAGGPRRKRRTAAEMEAIRAAFPKMAKEAYKVIKAAGKKGVPSPDLMEQFPDIEGKVVDFIKKYANETVRTEGEKAGLTFYAD